MQEVTTNDYFLNSANNVLFFFEENSFHCDGSLVQDKALSVNKCGHALHDLDPVFRRFSRSERMAEIYKSLGFQRPTPVQSMYIFKQPKIGGPVVAHQDRCVRDFCRRSRVPRVKSTIGALHNANVLILWAHLWSGPFRCA